ncbi:MAG: hypothetical protein ABI443_01360 [Chthoniobacterales bacterium]
MIRKLSFIVFVTTLCFSFNACEMHPASQTIKDESKLDAEKAEALNKGEQPQATDKNAAKFFPAKKTQ